MSIDLEKKVKIGCISAILVENINKKLIGEILTIVEASSSDIESRKAIKSLINQAFSRISNKIMLELNNLQEGVK